MFTKNEAAITWTYRSKSIDCSVKNHSFSIKDTRYDPLVGVALCALADIAPKCSKCINATAVIAVTDSGCVAHIERVKDGIVRMRPRQAFFARGGANMLATYVALALHSHGPCFSLSGGSYALKFAFETASNFIRSNISGQIVLLAADYEQNMVSSTALMMDLRNQEYLDKLRTQLVCDLEKPCTTLRNLMLLNEELER